MEAANPNFGEDSSQLKMEDAVGSLFFVVGFDDGPDCVAIYEIKSGDDLAICISPLVKAYPCTEERVFTVIGCDVLAAGSSSSEILCLMGSYMPLNEQKLIQLAPLLFDTKSKTLSDLPMPEATKPYPKVMAVQEEEGRRAGSFYVLAADTMCTGIRVERPCFERLDHLNREWDSSSIRLPEFSLPEKSPKAVVGYAVIKNNLLISVVDVRSGKETEFYFYQVWSSMVKWRPVKKEKKKERKYHALNGRSEYVGGFVYTLQQHCSLMKYRVIFSDSSDNNSIIESLCAPIKIRLKFLDPPIDRFRFQSSCFAHVTDGTFILARTGFRDECKGYSFVSIFYFKVKGLKVEDWTASGYYIHGGGAPCISGIFSPASWSGNIKNIVRQSGKEEGSSEEQMPGEEKIRIAKLARLRNHLATLGEQEVNITKREVPFLGKRKVSTEEEEKLGRGNQASKETNI